MIEVMRRDTEVTVVIVIKNSSDSDGVGGDEGSDAGGERVIECCEIGMRRLEKRWKGREWEIMEEKIEWNIEGVKGN